MALWCVPFGVGYVVKYKAVVRLEIVGIREGHGSGKAVKRPETARMALSRQHQLPTASRPFPVISNVVIS